jgi:hypothetical protein
LAQALIHLHLTKLSLQNNLQHAVSSNRNQLTLFGRFGLLLDRRLAVSVSGALRFGGILLEER